MGRSWVLVLAFLVAGAAVRAAPPLAAYGKLPAIEDVQISPDGALFAVIITNGDQRSIGVFNTADRKLIKTFAAGATKLRSLEWAGRENLIITVSKDTDVAWLEGSKQEWFLATDLNVRTWKAQGVLENVDSSKDPGGINMNTLLRPPMVRTVAGKTHVFVQAFHFSGSIGTDSLYDFDPKTGIATLVAMGPENTTQWLVDAAGKPLAQTLYDAKTKRWTFRARRGDSLRTVKTFEEDIEHPSMMGLGRDGVSVVLDVGAETKDGSRRDSFVELAPGAADWGAPFVDHDVSGLIHDPDTHKLLGQFTLEGEHFNYTFFSPSDQNIWNGTVKAYPDSDVTLISMSADHHKLIVRVDSATDGQAFALVDIDRHTGDWLGFNYEDASKTIALAAPIAFKAADGLALTGYLTLPPGRAAKDLPLVVFPHGGPAARDEPGFDWWAQAMASRGYAVLQVNYRGSYGFGWDFMKAGFGQFGRKMQTDLSDGVRYLAAKGTIDPKRVCIVGASYGGYAALAGATIDTGVYRCAVSVAGLSDLKRDINWSADDEHGGALSKRYWLRFMGVESANDAKLDEISPIRHVDKVTIPILLIHGKDDTVVDLSQSEVMYAALKKAGKDVDLVVLPHENHHLLTGATRLQMLEATMAFLAKNNPAD